VFWVAVFYVGVGAGLLVIVAALLRGRARRFPTRGAADRFARARGLRLTAANKALVAGYLAGTRRWRRGGAGVGFIAGGAAGVVWSSGVARAVVSGLIGIVVGYFVGAALAEGLARLGPSAGRRRTAELRARTRRHYVDTRMLRVVAVVPVVAALLFVLRWTSAGAGFDWPLPFALLMVVLCVVTAVELGVRRIVGRPRPSGEPEVIAACDVIAASAGQALVSAGGCVALWSLAWEAVLTVDVRDPALAAINVWVAGLAFVLGIAFWAQRNRIEHPSVAEPVA
jgi:hypothetical protein